MRSRWSRFSSRVRAYPRAAVLIVVVIGITLVGSAAYLATRSDQPSAGNLPTQTSAGRWSLVTLAQQIDAGNVTAVTLGTNGAGGQVLLAQTPAGEYVAISAPASVADGAQALISMGYGDLLSPNVRELADSTSVAASSDPVKSFINIGLLLVLGVTLAFFLWRMRDRLPIGARGAGRFSTIMPVPTPTGGGTTAPAPVKTAPPVGSSGLVHLDDVAGCEEAKLELAEPIEFLRHPDRFRSLGARVPRGILLYGPPGTGKTMLARAVATEAGVPFHHASGSDFVEKYVGVGARRVRDLFAQSRKLGKGVIFIDEFDALGKARGGANSHEEREQTLNQLLVEMDGFTTSTEIVVIAATNRLDVLDEALLRPGRFNRKVHVGLPDVAGRRAILDVHARNKPLSPDVDLDQIARKTYGFSGAQLADLLNEAAIIAARHEHSTISNEDMHAGWLKVAVGTGRRRSMNERDRAIIAAHEVGHAICGKVHGDTRRVEEISLFAHGEALGVTVSSQEDNDLPSESDLRARLIALMGGRAAEELLFQEVTPGAANDFEKATQIATSMVNRWGMGRDPRESESQGRGSLSFFAAKAGATLPSELQAAATRAVAAILDQAYRDARETLIENLATLRRIGVYLVQQERIDGDTFDALFDGRLEVPDADSEWRPAAARPRDWSSIGALATSLETPPQ
ncbi:MAG TPA: AAA family ATPase [Candidatus Limnocylindrales bacterium]